MVWNYNTRPSIFFNISEYKVLLQGGSAFPHKTVGYCISFLYSTISHQGPIKKEIHVNTNNSLMLNGPINTYICVGFDFSFQVLEGLR